MAQRSQQVIAQSPAMAAQVWLKGFAALMLQPSAASLLEITGIRPANSGIIYKFSSMPPLQFLGHLMAHEAPLLLVVLCGALLLMVFWTLAAMGLRQAWRGDRILALLFCISLGYWMLTSSGPQTTARFRAPMVAPAAVLAALGLAQLLHRRSQRSGSLPDRGKVPPMME